MSEKEIILVGNIEKNIYRFRDKNVMLDSDLAELYGVKTFNLNKAVKRNIERFPEDFMFQLTVEEFKNLKFQIGISSLYGGRRTRPYVFTEQGVAMLSSVLHSEKAISVNISIMRAFVRIRQMALTNEELARRLTELEKASKNLGKETKELRNSIDVIMQTINGMMIQHTPKKPQIGFKTDKK
mgnify:CR=1 FL=1